MVEIADIVDRESLREWLEGQPQHVSVVVAHRAAMRVLTSHWLWMLRAEEARENKLTALPVLMRSLILGVIAFGENYGKEVEVSPAAVQASNDAAKVAIQAANKALKMQRSPNVISNVDYAFAAYSAASTYSSYAVASLSNPFFASNAATTVETAANITGEVVDLWRSVRSDCEMIAGTTDIGSIPLWKAEWPIPSKEWLLVKAVLSVSKEDWSFWVRWYDAVLLGEPLNWNLQKRIALEVKEEDWEQGPQHVNGMIAEIELDFAVKATPNAELIVVNEDGKYASIPRSELPSKTLKDTNERILDVVVYIRISQKNSNQYSPLLPEADFLAGQLERYGDNALRLHEACAKVVIHVLRFVTAGSLPENDNVVGDVVSDLQNTADDIYNLDEEARATLDARERLRYDRLSGAQKVGAVRIAKAIADQSTKELGEEMVEDGAAIAGEEEPTEETKSNRYRFVSRILKIIAIGGAGVVAITTALSQAEPAVSGAKYLWKLIAPFLGL